MKTSTEQNINQNTQKKQQLIIQDMKSAQQQQAIHNKNKKVDSVENMKQANYHTPPSNQHQNILPHQPSQTPPFQSNAKIRIVRHSHLEIIFNLF